MAAAQAVRTTARPGWGGEPGSVAVEAVVIDLRTRRPAPVLAESALRTPARPTSRPAPGSPAPGAPLVLTRRGVVVLRVLVVVLVVLAALAVTLTASVRAGADDGRRTPVGSVHVVMPGETLWAIARQEAPGVDPVEVMVRLQEANDLPTTSLRVGQRLVVPAELVG